MMTGLAAFLFLMVVVITVLGCVSDIRSMRIPNVYSALILIGFVMAFAFSPQFFGRWWEYAGAFALVFSVTFGLFSAGMLGSGDTKFGSALALWVGLKGLIVYLLYMAIAGGVLGVASLFMRERKIFKNPPQDSWMAKAQAGKSVVPYGVAISFGFWMALFHTGIYHHIIDEVFKIIH